MKRYCMTIGMILLGISISAQELRMAVISDVHIMKPDLLKNDGAAFQDYLKHDRKMLQESAEILNETIHKISEQHPKFLLISGDLTKDGERQSHLFLRDNFLSELKAKGIQPLVIPGNHDINNPHAVEYDGKNTKRVLSISSTEFSDLYKDYGYAAAIARDSFSLSYVFQLDNNTRLIAIDACKYELNDFDKDVCRTDGRIKPETMNFILLQAKYAEEKGMRVIAMMHHGLMEHWKYQNKVLPDYVVDDWKKQLAKFKKAGIEVCFTGHLHAQDISCYKGVYDVETGSPVSYPSPFRFVTIKDNTMIIHSDRIDMVNGTPLTDVAKKKTEEGFKTIINGMFPKKVDDMLRQDATNKMAEAFARNYAGDESLTQTDRNDIKNITRRLRKYSLKWSIVFNRIAKSVLSDSNTKDNSLIINLKNKMK